MHEDRKVHSSAQLLKSSRLVKDIVNALEIEFQVHLKQVRTSSRYVDNNTNMMCGVGVNLTYSFSTAGIITPLFISIMGLAIGELFEDNYLVLRIQGLSIGDSGVSVGKKEVGHVLFMRGEHRRKKQRYNFHRNNVFLFFVA